MSGIKDEIRKLLGKVLEQLRRLDTMRDKQAQTKKNIERAITQVAKMPHGPEKNAALLKGVAMKQEIESLEGKTSFLRTRAESIRNLLNRLFGLAGETDGLEIAIVLPLAATAVLFAAIAGLWKITINRTRELNLRSKALEMVATGAISSSQFETFVKKRAAAKAGPLSDIMKILTIAFIMMILPTVLKGARAVGR